MSTDETEHNWTHCRVESAQLSLCLALANKWRHSGRPLSADFHPSRTGDGQRCDPPADPIVTAPSEFFSPRDSILFLFSHCINFDFINEMNENVEIFLSGNFPPNRRRIFRWKWMNPLTNFNKLIQILKVNQRKMSEFPPKTEISAE